MADFLPAFEKMILREGGYKLTNDPTDRGGQTYAGIARTRNPQWEGWPLIDSGQSVPAAMVRAIYCETYWDPLRLGAVIDQRAASSLFDFAVNAGTGTSAKLAQIVVATTPDGQVGPKTVTAINATDPALFLAHFTLAKIARYRDIVRRDKTQIKYLMGWINRALEQAA